MYVSSFKVAVFGGSGEKIRLNVRVDGFSSRGSKIYSSRSAYAPTNLNWFDME